MLHLPESVKKLTRLETLLWPAAAGVAPDLVRADGELVSGNAILFPLRTIGLVLFCTGTIWLSLKIRKP